ncbi:hypothetical protein BC834DRAFT_853681 [Gloeopeniophorella convolvens]|nr:hypothetical protein BC834DRAFT_853681 [Gloeopeniophorella convolvens]
MLLRGKPVLLPIFWSPSHPSKHILSASLNGILWELGCACLQVARELPHVTPKPVRLVCVSLRYCVTWSSLPCTCCASRKYDD